MRFTEALDRKMEEITRPPVLPLGNYVWVVSKHPDSDEIEGKDGTKWDRLTFPLKCVSATDDVDPDELAEFGNPAGALDRKVFLFNTSDDKEAEFDKSMFQVKQFLVNCGVAEDVPLNEGLGDCVGMQVMGELRHRPDVNDPEIIWTEVGRTAPA
jgi:hypothetical protein